MCLRGASDESVRIITGRENRLQTGATPSFAGTMNLESFGFMPGFQE
jgi:hypothetical protein